MVAVILTIWQNLGMRFAQIYVVLLKNTTLLYVLSVNYVDKFKVDAGQFVRYNNR